MAMKSIKKAILKMVVGGALVLVVTASGVLVGSEGSGEYELNYTDTVRALYCKPGFDGK